MANYRNGNLHFSRLHGEVVGLDLRLSKRREFLYWKCQGLKIKDISYWTSATYSTWDMVSTWLLAPLFCLPNCPTTVPTTNLMTDWKKLTNVLICGATKLAELHLFVSFLPELLGCSSRYLALHKVYRFNILSMHMLKSCWIHGTSLNGCNSLSLTVPNRTNTFPTTLGGKAFDTGLVIGWLEDDLESPMSKARAYMYMIGFN